MENCCGSSSSARSNTTIIKEALILFTTSRRSDLHQCAAWLQVWKTHHFSAPKKHPHPHPSSQSAREHQTTLDHIIIEELTRNPRNQFDSRHISPQSLWETRREVAAAGVADLNHGRCVTSTRFTLKGDETSWHFHLSAGLVGARPDPLAVTWNRGGACLRNYTSSWWPVDHQLSAVWTLLDLSTFYNICK